MIYSLKKRHEIEKKFHDQWASKTDVKEVLVKESFESITALENRYALKIMGNLKNKKILDVGCGLGDASVYFAKKGARVEAIDISPEMIRVTKELAKLHKVSKRVNPRCIVAENLDYPDNYFDFIFGNGALHHIDLRKSIPKIYRVLKPSGKAVFVEPLSYNPIINVYRKIAMSVRTETEQPLTMNQIGFIGSHFKKWHQKPFHLFTLLIMIWFFVGERVNPGKERYWKKILKDGHKYKRSFNFLNTLDRLVLHSIPSLGRYCWNTVIVLNK